MGMNYYLRKKAKLSESDCIHDSSIQKLSNGYVFKNTFYSSLSDLNKDYYKEYHIGKNSFGWHFLLATYPSESILTLKDWKELFEYYPIYDEDNNLIDKNDMLKLILDKPGFTNRNISEDEVIKYRYEFGKKGLLKHHDENILNNETEGTYDICSHADFS